MAITATITASVKTAGGTAGPLTAVIPPVVSTNAVNINTTVNVPAGFTALTSTAGAPLLGSACLTNATGIWFIPPSGSTSCAMAFATTASSMVTAQFPTPAFISGGFTLANVGVCLSAATTLQIIVV